MADGLEVLDAWIEGVRSLPGLAREAAPELAPIVERHVRESIAAGVGPDGKEWPKTQDGRTALRDAGKALTVAVSGTTVLAKLEGIVAAHHLGRVRGHVKRQILPSAKLPGKLVELLRKKVGDVFVGHMEGK